MSVKPGTALKGTQPAHWAGRDKYYLKEMTAGELRTIYLIAIVLECAASIYLSFANLRHARSMIGKLPAVLAATYSPDYQKKAVAYLEAKTFLGIASEALSMFVIAGMVLLGFFGHLDASLRSWGLDSRLTGILFFMGTSAVFGVIDLPFDYCRIFKIEEAFGFNKMTLGLWLRDLVKGIVLSGILGLPLLYVLLSLLESSGSYWWIYAVAAISMFELVVLFLYPTLIAPLFNRFTPVGKGSLLDAIEKLADRCGFSIAGIFSMDGSRRSSHGNAFFAGFGRTKRIVLFDTLIEQLSTAEVCAVLAHEIGHEKKGHIRKSFLFSILIMTVLFWGLAAVVSSQLFYETFGFSQQSSYAALAIFSFALAPLGFFLSPALKLLSRAFEYQADRYAVQVTGTPDDLISALIKLSEKSLSNLTPHPLYSFFRYSHPALVERIEAMRGHPPPSRIDDGRDGLSRRSHSEVGSPTLQ